MALFNMISRARKLFRSYEDQQKYLTDTIEELRSQNAHLTRDLELLREALKEKVGLPTTESLKKIAENGFSSETYQYFAFENQFRGNKEAVLSAQNQYLPFIQQASLNSKGDYFLDVGCGRGEFIDLLSINNIQTRGIDLTLSMVEHCKNKGQQVVQRDVLEYLKEVGEGSLIGISAFQVIEHLSPDYLIEFIKTAFDKIKKNGVFILETVNPNSFTSLKNFYLDLTHKNPIPPLTLKFILENSGFKKINIQYSSFIPESEKLQGKDKNTLKLNDLLFGPQDYAGIGWR